MAEIILSAPITLLLEKLVLPELIKIFRRARVHTDINKWTKMLITIEAVLDNAEEKQVSNRAVKIWLDELQDLTSDLEDILDEFATEALRVNLKAKSQASTSKLRSLIPACGTSFKSNVYVFNSQMEAKIKDISTRLKDIISQKRNLDLIENVGRRSYKATTTERPAVNIPTTSVPESHVHGRENEKAAIRALLLGGGETEACDLCVIPIIGMGGVGKTTLARLLYNDDSVDISFDIKGWVCVSEEFDIFHVTKAILESFTSETIGSNCSLEFLQRRLVERLSKKKFLLVLDDVWHENYNDWTILRRPLEAGAPGSKIIVTTRNHGVSQTVGTIPGYTIKELSNADCLYVFAQHAFGTSNFDSYPMFKEVGEGIVKRCKGLPLAAKLLGGLLRFEVNLNEWEAVLNSNIWDLPEEKCGILPALRLSYLHLPPHLKQCFAYCSIFPKDYEFEEDGLVRLWMAAGNIPQQHSQEKQMEDIGGGYFRELLSRSLFQQSSTNESMFVMHDLINDLAQWVAGETTFRLEGKKSKISTKARHSSYIGSRFDGFKKFENFKGLERLRTFLPLMTPNSSFLTIHVPLNLLPRFKCLRVLSLSNYYITELPSSIGDLKHLRYFDLSYTKLKSLPESTSTLYNLQTLILKGCSRLKKLPPEMHNLINLRHLDITGADTIEEMPPRVGNLLNLQSLSNFIVGNNGGLRELMRLNYLRRTLCISRLENVADARDAREAMLKDKQDLDELTLQWSSELNGWRNERAQKEVLDMLQPDKKLKGLTIKCYGGISFSNWVGDPCFSNIVLLRLEDCGKCKFLPPVGQLSMLKDLLIKGMKKVKNVGIEFCGEGIGKPFSSLETLRFEDMEEWEQWFPCGIDRQVEVFPQLRKLSVTSCPKLLGTIPGHLPSLEKLKIEGCQLLSVSISSLPKLCKLHIKGCQEVVQSSFINIGSLKSMVLSEISNLTCVREEGFVKSLRKVEELEICSCKDVACLWKTEELAEEAEEVGCRLKSLKLIGYEKLENLQGLHSLTTLRELTISNCPRLVYFPETDLPCTLKEVRIQECHSLKSVARGGQLPSMLKKLVIWECKNLQCLVEEDSTMQKSNTTSLLERLEIHHCPSLTSLSSRGGGELPATLKHLEIRDCLMLESITEEFCNDSSLENIFINYCKSLKSLPKGLHNLSHLREIRIWSCPNLVLFPVLAFPSTNLRHIWITGCEKVEALPNLNLGCLRELRIGGYPGIISFPEDAFPTNLTTLGISNLKINKLLLQWGLHRFTSLKDLSIFGGIPDLTSFPPEKEEDGMMLPASLTELSIGHFPNLENLSSKGFQNLESLECLRIFNCPKLKSFPKEGLPRSLLKLIIYECPLLEEGCKNDRGRHWTKIAHIPCVEINDRFIHDLDEEILS